MQRIRSLGQVFYDPEGVFRASPSFFLPFILGLLLTLLALWLAMPLISQLQLEKLQETFRQMPNPPDLSTFQRRMLLYSMLSVLVVFPLKILLQGLVFHGVMPLVGGEGEYGYALVAVAYGSWISSVGNLVKALLSRITGIFPLHLDLAILLPSDAANNPLAHVLSQIDLFTLWSLWVIGTGLAVLYGTHRRKGYGVVIGVWAVYLLLLAVLSIFGPGPKFARMGG